MNLDAFIKEIKFTFSKQNEPPMPKKFDWRLKDSSIHLLNNNDVEFAFAQAEKQLDGTVGEADVILNRTMILFGFNLGLMTSLTGYVVGFFGGGDVNLSLLVTAIIGVIYLACDAFKLIANIKGHKYGTLGTEPALLLDEYFVLNIPDADKRQIIIYVRELKSYQKKIYANKVKNAKRWLIFKKSLQRMIFLPFILIITFVASKIIELIIFPQ